MSHGFRTICNETSQPSVSRTQVGETHREEDMTSSRNGERKNHTPATAVHSPTNGNQRSAQDDYHRNQSPRDSQGKPVLLQDLRHFLEEVTLLHLLDGGTPSNVEREQVGEDGKGHWDRETAKEEKEEWNPFNVLEECPNECFVP